MQSYVTQLYKPVHYCASTGSHHVLYICVHTYLCCLISWTWYAGKYVCRSGSVRLHLHGDSEGTHFFRSKVITGLCGAVQFTAVRSQWIVPRLKEEDRRREETQTNILKQYSNVPYSKYSIYVCTYIQQNVCSTYVRT